MSVTPRRRVAVTGIGLVTPVGNDVSTTWASVLAGRSGVAPISLFDASDFSTRIAAEVKGFGDEALETDRKLLKFANRSHRFALGAAEEAMRDAGIAPTPQTSERWGCSVGTGMMGPGIALGKPLYLGTRRGLRGSRCFASPFGRRWGAPSRPAAGR